MNPSAKPNESQSPESLSSEKLEQPESSSDLSRRRFLQTGLIGGTASLMSAGSINLLTEQRLEAQTPLTPDAALKALMDGNERFITGRMTSFEDDLQELKAKNVDKQEPFAGVLSCADSRVPVELIFDQSIGHIFVTRVAGNVVTPEIIGSLEYGVAVLGTKVILVLGHAGCGAVKAAIQGKPVPGQISSLFAHIQPAVDQAGHDLDAAVKVNAKLQAALLRETSSVIAPLVKEGKLKVVAGYYDLATGKLTLLES
jgi:carbonic anhydrase